MTPYETALLGKKWTQLEFEEQACVRQLMRDGKAMIEGTGADRRVVARPKATDPLPVLRRELNRFFNPRG